jgi:hypothetical protein
LGHALKSLYVPSKGMLPRNSWVTEELLGSVCLTFLGCRPFRLRIFLKNVLLRYLWIHKAPHFFAQFFVAAQEFLGSIPLLGSARYRLRKNVRKSRRRQMNHCSVSFVFFFLSRYLALPSKKNASEELLGCRPFPLRSAEDSRSSSEAAFLARQVHQTARCMYHWDITMICMWTIDWVHD